MRTILQRVQFASVKVDGQLISQIKKGLLVLVGFEEADTEEDQNWMANKLVNLRIFDDEKGVMNKSVQDVDGEILCVSQFTLFAMTKKGNRPSYIRAAKGEISEPMYNEFCKKLQALLNKEIKMGIFGADMKVELLNDGPVTISIDSKNKE